MSLQSNCWVSYLKTNVTGTLLKFYIFPVFSLTLDGLKGRKTMFLHTVLICNIKNVIRKWENGSGEERTDNLVMPRERVIQSWSRVADSLQMRRFRR